MVTPRQEIFVEQEKADFAKINDPGIW